MTHFQIALRRTHWQIEHTGNGDTALTRRLPTSRALVCVMTTTKPRETAPERENQPARLSVFRAADWYGTSGRSALLDLRGPAGALVALVER